MDNPFLTIDLLRHGEPLGGPRYRGRRDDPLTPTGWQQMEAASGGNPPWQHIISSPLQRCAAFATQLSQTHSLPLHMEPHFTEIDFGDWEGMTSQQIMAQDSQRLSAYWQNPATTTPPNGETLATFEARVISAWQHLLAQHRHKHLLVVTHGGVMRVIFRHLLEIPQHALFSVDVPYACLSRLRYTSCNRQPQLLFHNRNSL